VRRSHRERRQIDDRETAVAARDVGMRVGDGQGLGRSADAHFAA
jgi:hypothetical protein